MSETSKPENLDLPILKQNRSKSGQKTTLERRQEMIENYVKKFGLSIAKKFSKKIAEDYKIGVRQVYKDWDWIKGNFKLEDIMQAKIDLTIIRNRALEEAFLALSSEFDKAKAIQTAMNVAKQFREELEAWGIKPKEEDMSPKLEEQSIKKEVFGIYQELAEAYIESFKERREDEGKLKEILKDKLGEKLFEETFKEIEEKIFDTKEIFGIAPFKNKDGIIQKIITIGSYKKKEEVKHQ